MLQHSEAIQRNTAPRDPRCALLQGASENEAAADEAAAANALFEEKKLQELQKEAKKEAEAEVVRRAGLAPTIRDELREHLSSNWMRLKDVYRTWDTNGDGNLTRNEFMRGLKIVGMDLSPDDMTAICSTFDPDNSGTIELRELEGAIRKRSPQETQDAPEPATAATRPAVRQRGSLLDGGANPDDGSDAEDAEGSTTNGYASTVQLDQLDLEVRVSH